MYEYDFTQKIPVAIYNGELEIDLSRKEWEREQCFRKMILTDAEFCQSQAGSFDHFIFLMKRIGYQFEYGKYLSVKVPGGKWYHELDKLDERFSEEKFRFV